MSLGFIHSQEINCFEKQKELSEFVAKNEYKQATELLLLLTKKCNKQSEEMYLLGIKTLQYNVDLATEASKEVAIKDLLKFYDSYDANFPYNTNGNLVNKAMLLFDNKLLNESEIFGFLDKAFALNQNQFSSANSLYIYFKLYTERFKSKKENITLKQLIEKYHNVVLIIQNKSVVYPEKEVEFTNANIACKSLIKEYLIPENLISMAEENFEANTDNIKWLETTANILSDKCASSFIFGKIAARLNHINPTSKSAFHLGNYNLKNRGIVKAVEYFKQSANLASDKNEKARIYFTVATVISATDKAEARKMIFLAMENDTKNGSFYLFLSNLYANSINECGTLEIVKKAIYNLANQTAQKAAEIEPRLKSSANQLAIEYAKNNPTKLELEQIQKSGGKVAIGCWINETVEFK